MSAWIERVKFFLFSDFVAILAAAGLVVLGVSAFFLIATLIIGALGALLDHDKGDDK